jgi:hypothetical protein
MMTAGMFVPPSTPDLKPLKYGLIHPSLLLVCVLQQNGEIPTDVCRVCIFVKGQLSELNITSTNIKVKLNISSYKFNSQ